MTKIAGGKGSQFRITMRTKRKKTFSELKEEENLLLMERVELNKSLEKMQAAFKDLREKTEKLKKLKLNLESLSAENTDSIASDLPPATPAFELPDLNLLPL